MVVGGSYALLPMIQGLMPDIGAQSIGISGAVGIYIRGLFVMKQVELSCMILMAFCFIRYIFRFALSCVRVPVTMWFC